MDSLSLFEITEIQESLEQISTCLEAEKLHEKLQNQNVEHSLSVLKKKDFSPSKRDLTGTEIYNSPY